MQGPYADAFASLERSVEIAHELHNEHDIADNFDGRPVLMRAYAALGRALESLGRTEEAIDAHARSAEILEWIRGSLRPEHAQSYVARPDIHELVQRTISVLETGGRMKQAAILKSWLESEE